MNHKKRSNFILNATICLILVIAALLLVSSFIHLPALGNVLFYNAQAAKLVQRIIALLLFIVSWNLYLRKQAAYFISIICLTANLFSHLGLLRNTLYIVTSVLEILVLIVLLLYRRKFTKRTDAPSAKKALVFSLIAITLVFFNALLSNHKYLSLSGKRPGFRSSLGSTLKMLIAMNDSTPLSNAFELTICILFWGCVIFAVLLMLKVTIYNKHITKMEKDKAHELVIKYGGNPASYLTLEADKHLFFGEEVEGVIGYGIVENVIVVNGDPCCKEEDLRILLFEFKSYCRDGGYQCVFLSIMDRYLDAYKDVGYSYVKCGEEARIDLQKYNLKGNRVGKLRAEYNYAVKRGLTTHEYRPLEKRDPDIERQIVEISDAWLKNKKSSELTFTVGEIGLEHPMDKRYFYCLDESGKMIAFDVFIPFASMKGYMADITRRLKEAPRGTNEKLTYEAFAAFRDEGLLYGSLGVSPLSGVVEEGIKESATTKLFDFMFEKGNYFYGFKDLRQAKQKFAPTSWEPSYFAFSTKNMTASMAYAIVRIQNPRGILDYVTGGNRKAKKDR